MKKLLILFTLVFSMSAFASGFAETSDLEIKEKAELSQDVDFDQVEVIEAVSFDNSHLLVVDVGKQNLFNTFTAIAIEKNEADLNRLNESLNSYGVVQI